MLAVFCAENSREIRCARCASARRKALAASVFVLLYQQLRQYFYFCTSSCVSICTFVLASASVFVLLYQQLRQYLYFCTSSCVSICTFVVYVLLCYPTCASAASIFCIHIMHTHTHTAVLPNLRECGEKRRSWLRVQTRKGPERVGNTLRSKASSKAGTAGWSEGVLA